MLKSFWDISLTCHPDSLRKEKKLQHITEEIKTDNQNVMKEHFLFKTASQSDWMLLKTCVFFVFVSLFFSRLGV